MAASDARPGPIPGYHPVDGDILHLAREARPPLHAAWGETYLLDEEQGKIGVRLLAHTHHPSKWHEDLAEAAYPLAAVWAEAGPDRLTIVRDGRVIYPPAAEDDPAREVYRERARLVAFLAALYPSAICAGDPAEPDWPVLYVTTPAGQMSWHIAQDDLDLFSHVPQVASDRPDAPVWDGHSTGEKYERLRQLTRDLAGGGTL